MGSHLGLVLFLPEGQTIGAFASRDAYPQEWGRYPTEVELNLGMEAEMKVEGYPYVVHSRSI